jgi:hypothetical protein
MKIIADTSNHVIPASALCEYIVYVFHQLLNTEQWVIHEGKEWKEYIFIF